MGKTPRRSRIKRITKKSEQEEKYVYDISMKDRNKPWFYGNNMLLHNSAYFSVYEAFRDQYEKQSQHMTGDSAIEMYDVISKQTNDSFPSFMNERFNTGLENGAIIKAGRENLAEYSLFIKKKRYAMKLYDKDGFRQDIDGKTGKLKVMGIEIKRSDTPKEIQEALSTGLNIVLDGGTPDDMIEYFKEFKETYKSKEPWRMGRPSAANAISFYTRQLDEYETGKSKTKPRISGPVQGAIAWNRLCDIYEESHIPRITDMSKVVTCKLRPNDYGFNSISYLTDQTKFPEWFRELPFDTEAMLQGVLYKKIENIFGILDWNLDYIKSGSSFDQLFDKIDVDALSKDDFF